MALCDVLKDQMCHNQTSLRKQPPQSNLFTFLCVCVEVRPSCSKSVSGSILLFIVKALCPKLDKYFLKRRHEN